MYAMLGNVRFELLEGFTALEETHTADFARHEVLKGRPRLQALRNALTEIRFSLRLHWKLGNPDTAFKGLVAAKEAQQAVALVYGSGRFAGWFVIESVSSHTLVTDGQGRTASREVDVSLTEFVGDPNNPLPTPAVKTGGQNPLLSLLPESVRGQVSQVAQAVEKGVKIYRAAQSGIAEMQNIIRTARDLKNDPAAALRLLGSALDAGGGILGRLNGLPEVTSRLGDLAGAVKFTEQAAQAADRLGETVGILRAGVESGSVGGWIEAAGNAVSEASGALENGAAAAQTLTGWLALRKDKA